MSCLSTTSLLPAPLPLGVNASNLIGAGSSGVVAIYPGNQIVIKIPLVLAAYDGVLCRQRCERERQAYERLTAAPLDQPATLLRYLGPMGDGILLEYAEGGSLETFLLDRHCRLKLADFTGASIDDGGSLSYYSVDHMLPQCLDSVNAFEGSIAISTASEIFAFGSLLYEMATRQRPYAGMDSAEIVSRFRARQFPDVVPLGLNGSLIAGLWKLELESMARVLKVLECLIVYPTLFF